MCPIFTTLELNSFFFSHQFKFYTVCCKIYRKYKVNSNLWFVQLENVAVKKVRDNKMYKCICVFTFKVLILVFKTSLNCTYVGVKTRIKMVIKTGVICKLFLYYT